MGRGMDRGSWKGDWLMRGLGLGRDQSMGMELEFGTPGGLEQYVRERFPGKRVRVDVC